MADEERLSKLLQAYTRLVEVERKKIRLSYDRLIELGAEVERMAGHLESADTDLNASVYELNSAIDAIRVAIEGEEEEVEEVDESANEDTGGFEEVEVDEVDGDEVDGVEEPAVVQVPIAGP
jgi:hypothetical protein